MFVIKWFSYNNFIYDESNFINRNGGASNMAIGEKLTTEVKAWGTLAIVLVIVSIVLLKFKENDSMTTALNSTVDTFVSAISEPKNWVAIVIIAIVGFAMLKLFTGKNKD